MINKTSLLKLKNVCKTYYLDGISVEAIKNINLEIKKGEFVSIGGPSGSGKSTLMHIIGLLDRPTKGEYYFAGKLVSKLPDSKLAELRNKKIGFVFQTFNLLPRISALENVKLPLIYGQIGEKNRKKLALEKLKQVGLEHRVEHHSNQLSGGQQQRVALARALVNKPELILADEPTGNLDSKTGIQIMKLLRKLNEQGNTIVVVSHDDLVTKRTKRIITLRDGEILEDRSNENY